MQKYEEILDDLGILEHFKLTKQSFKDLEVENIPDNILAALKPLEDQEFTDKDKFLDAVRDQIAEEQTVKYERLILKYARILKEYEKLKEDRSKIQKRFAKIGQNMLEAREIKGSFKLTEQSFENLKVENIPDNILAALKPLEDQEFTDKDKFLDAVREQIAEEQTVNKYKERILKHAEDIDSYSYFNRADIYGINQCLHLASSFVLLGSKSEALSNEISKIRNKEVCKEKDPTTIISIAALYYLLVTNVDGLSEEEKKGLRVIKDRFEELCWMVGENVRKNYLEIPGGVADE